MNRMVRYFVNGLLLSTPIALTWLRCVAFNANGEESEEMN